MRVIIRWAIVIGYDEALFSFPASKPQEMSGKPDTLQRREVVTAFLRHAGRILLVRRSDRVGTYRGRWSGISGYLEKTEPLDQVRCEIQEETGLAPDSCRLASAGEPLVITDVDIGVQWKVHLFLFDIDDPAAIRLDWENRELVWVEPGELARYPTVPALQEALENCLRREQATQAQQ